MSVAYVTICNVFDEKQFVCCGFVFSGLLRFIFSVSSAIDSVSFCGCPPISLVFSPVGLVSLVPFF